MISKIKKTKLVNQGNLDFLSLFFKNVFSHFIRLFFPFILISLAFMKNVLPNYFSSEWSFSSFHIQESRSLVCFAPDKDVIFGLKPFDFKNKIFFLLFSFFFPVFIVVCADGSFYSYAFDALKGGECRQETFTKFIK